jgi:hypothetical protein
LAEAKNTLVSPHLAAARLENGGDQGACGEAGSRQ